MSRQFRIIFNAILPESALAEVRSRAKSLAAALLDGGAWVETTQIRTSDHEDGIQCIVDIAGPRLQPELAETARASLVAMATYVKAEGGRFKALEFAHGKLSENMFEEHPELVTPDGEVAPKPLSVQRDEALAAKTAAETEKAEALAAASRAEARELSERTGHAADVADLQAQLADAKAASNAAILARDAEIARLESLKNEVVAERDRLKNQYEPSTLPDMRPTPPQE